MALIDTYNLAFHSTLRRRICGACWKAASDILNEDAGTTNHANRVLWAKQVLTENNDGPMVKRLSVAVAQNSTVAAAGAESATDNDIQFVVNSFINSHADGVYGA